MSRSAKTFFPGTPVGEDLVLVSPFQALHRNTGEVVYLNNALPIEQIFDIKDKEPNAKKAEKEARKVVKEAVAPKKRSSSYTINKEIEKVVGVDEIILDLSLKNSDGKILDTNGFLIEVYESGSDGNLNRVYAEPIIDFLNDDIVRASFMDYFSLEVDKK